jgi:hypothetical protein
MSEPIKRFDFNNTTNCGNCAHMKGKLTIKNGKFQFKEFIASCAKGQFQLTGFGRNEEKTFKYGVSSGKLGTLPYRSWKQAKICVFFTSMED